MTDFYTPEPKGVFEAFAIVVQILPRVYKFLWQASLCLANSAALSKARETAKASQLKVGMKLRAVKALRGEPQWASIVVDEGRLAIRERNMELVLRWRNRSCVPVIVTFRRGLKITDWDDGRLWWYRS